MKNGKSFMYFMFFNVTISTLNKYLSLAFIKLTILKLKLLN